MTERLLKTKLYIPRPNSVPRTRLVERLNACLRQNGAFAHKLSLISAPAGFGKTSLACELSAACRRLEPDVDVAWLSLDAGDNDPSRFWTYVVAALQTVDADVGAGSQDQSEDQGKGQAEPGCGLDRSVSAVTAM